MEQKEKWQVIFVSAEDHAAAGELQCVVDPRGQSVAIEPMARRVCAALNLMDAEQHRETVYQDQQ